MDYGFHAPTMSWPVAGGLLCVACHACLPAGAAMCPCARLQVAAVLGLLLWVQAYAEGCDPHLDRCSQPTWRPSPLCCVLQAR